MCPSCKAETSDMLNNCEWCGAPLVGQKPTGETDGPVSGVYSPPPPSDASYPAHGLPDSEWPRRERGTAPKNRHRTVWYKTPWPYVACALIAAVVAAFFLLGGGAKAYPELVVANQPTLINVYTDT
jgi:hypothetical protein